MENQEADDSALMCLFYAISYQCLKRENEVEMEKRIGIYFFHCYLTETYLEVLAVTCFDINCAVWQNERIYKDCD